MLYSQRKMALRCLIFLKEKCDGSIKARGCADRCSQSEYTTKAEKSYPTVLIEAMMLTCTIEAKEGRLFAVTDIPGAFLHTNMDQDVHMILEGEIAKLIIRLEPTLYRKST